MEEGDEREERGGASDAQLAAEVSARETEVNGLLKRGDKVKALIASLQNPPLSAKSAAIKDGNAAIVEKVLAALTDAELAGAVAALELDACDVLMKYIYRTMARPTGNNLLAPALKLHAILTEKAGVGSIVRVLTDRKQV